MCERKFFLFIFVFFFKSGATHDSSDVKEKVVLTWNAPEGLSETVRFRVTVAKDGGTFWVGHLTEPVVVKAN